MKKQTSQQSKTVNYKDYDQSKYKSWLQQKYAQLYAQELLLWDTTKESHEENIENGIKENEND